MPQNLKSLRPDLLRLFKTPKSPVKIRLESERIISKAPQKIVERPEKETPVVRTRSGRVVHRPMKLDL